MSHSLAVEKYLSSPNGLTPLHLSRNGADDAVDRAFSMNSSILCITPCQTHPSCFLVWSVAISAVLGKNSCTEDIAERPNAL